MRKRYDSQEELLMLFILELFLALWDSLYTEVYFSKYEDVSDVAYLRKVFVFLELKLDPTTA
jgi:hypothetical protein